MAPIESMPEAIQKSVAGLSVVDKLRMLLDITKTISRSLDLQEVLNLVMDTLDSLIPYDAAGIYLVKCSQPLNEWDGGPDETCVFHTEAVRGYDIADLQELRLKMGEGLIGHVALRGKPFVSPDVRNEPRYINARARTRSEMVAPIISNQEVIGVFDLESDELNAYSNDDLEVLMLLASQVAIIIEKVMLHEQAIEKQRLETQLEIARQVLSARGGHAEDAHSGLLPLELVDGADPCPGQERGQTGDVCVVGSDDEDVVEFQPARQAFPVPPTPPAQTRNHLCDATRLGLRVRAVAIVFHLDQAEPRERNITVALDRLPVTFGLGRQDKIDRVVIQWPSRRTEEYKNLAAGRSYVCVEGKGITAEEGF